MDEWRMRGSQIPAFGNWEYVNDLPITQYFESARQAGLIRYSSSSGECDHHHHPCNNHNYNNNNNNDVSPDFVKNRAVSRPKQGKGNREKRFGVMNVREASKKQAGKVYDVNVTELPVAQVQAKRHPSSAAVVKKKQHQYQYDAGYGAQPRKLPKAVDEDLYKIPPELLKRKRRLGFISRCLVPPCAV